MGSQELKVGSPALNHVTDQTFLLKTLHWVSQHSKDKIQHPFSGLQGHVWSGSDIILLHLLSFSCLLTPLQPYQVLLVGRYVEHIPASGPLHMLFLPPGMIILQSFAWLIPSLYLDLCSNFTPTQRHSYLKQTFLWPYLIFLHSI